MSKKKLSLTFDELKKEILKSNTKSEYKQSSINIVRGEFEKIEEQRLKATR